MELNDIKIGEHFWAFHNNKLSVFIRESQSNRCDDGIYIAGNWEGGFKWSELEFVCIIKSPQLKAH